MEVVVVHRIDGVGNHPRNDIALIPRGHNNGELELRYGLEAFKFAGQFVRVTVAQPFELQPPVIQVNEQVLGTTDKNHQRNGQHQELDDEPQHRSGFHKIKAKIARRKIRPVERQHPLRAIANVG